MIVELIGFATKKVIEIILNSFGASIQNPNPLAER